MENSRAETAVQTVVPKSRKSDITELKVPPAAPVPSMSEGIGGDGAVEEIEELILDAPPTVVDQLLDDLRKPLGQALADAERVLGDDERVGRWLETQARPRMIRLAERLSDELRATEEKRRASEAPASTVKRSE